MAEPIRIEVFRQKNADELSAALSDPESRLETGGAAAVTAALSAALLKRAASLTLREYPDSERAGYILRNAEILRTYMLHLIDEDIRSRQPLRRALKEGGALEIEAARQPAVAIPAEIINMMSQELELTKELSSFCPMEAMHYIGESTELAVAAVRSARLFIVDMSDKCSDETYRFVIRRENEISLSSIEKTAQAILDAAEEAI